MTAPSDLAPVYTAAATRLRDLAHTGEPLHPKVLLALAQHHQDLAHNAEDDHLNTGEWAGFDEPGDAHRTYTLATLLTNTPPTPARPQRPLDALALDPLPAHQALQAGLTWLHHIPQPPTALIDHRGLPLRTTNNRTLRFVAAGPQGKAVIALDVTRLTWKNNGKELIPTDRIGPTELTDLTTLLRTLNTRVMATYNGHPTITGTLLLQRPAHPTLTAAITRYQAGCPTHPTHCRCGWYQRGRAQIIHPTP